MLVVNLLIYIISFIFIWFGAGLIVTSTSKFSKKLKLSPFAFSFVFLGILTSTPEFSVGLQSVAHGDTEIFVGNLLGGIIVLFLVIIPILAIFGNGVNLKHGLDGKILLATLLVIATPSIFILDKTVTLFEGLLMIILYVGLLFLIERKNGIFDKSNDNLLNIKAYSYKDIFKIILGLGIVFISSFLIVDKTIYFAEIINVPTFYISLIVISLGTDLPELSVAIRSVLSGKNEIAMGDYLGAAAASTLLFGIFTVLNSGEVFTLNNFIVTFVFIVIALTIFYILTKTKKYISRNHGLIMLAVYLLFVYLEVLR